MIAAPIKPHKDEMLSCAALDDIIRDVSDEIEHNPDNQLDRIQKEAVISDSSQSADSAYDSIDLNESEPKHLLKERSLNNLKAEEIACSSKKRSLRTVAPTEEFGVCLLRTKEGNMKEYSIRIDDGVTLTLSRERRTKTSALSYELNQLQCVPYAFEVPRNGERSYNSLILILGSQH